MYSLNILSVRVVSLASLISFRHALTLRTIDSFKFQFRVIHERLFLHQLIKKYCSQMIHFPEISDK